MNLKRNIAALAFVFTLTLITVARGQDGPIAWLTNLEEAKRQAASENKLVLVHFWGGFCRPCLNLEKFVFTNPRVGSAVCEHYIPVKIDVEAQPKLAQEFGITTIPHDVIITPSGQIIAKQASSPNSDGYLRMIQSVAAKAGRTNPQSIAAAQQIAQSVPEGPTQITNAYVPDGQSSVLPEPIRMIGNSAPSMDSPIQTVGGQMLIPQAKDERKLTSPPPAQQFLHELQLTPMANSTTETASSGPTKSHIPADPQLSQSLQTLRPLSDMSAPNTVKTQFPQRPSPQASNSIAAPLNIAAEANQSIDKNSLASTANKPAAFGGSCPVTWFATGKFVAGDPQWGCEHRGRLYLFASRQLRDQFRLTPDVLSPMLAGYDPVTYASTGALLDGNLDHSVVVESDQQKTIYLFSSADNRVAFQLHSQKYIDEVRQALRTADQTAANR